MIFETIIIDNSGIPVLTWFNEGWRATNQAQTDPLIISGLLASLERFSSEFLHETFQEFYLESTKMILVTEEKDSYRLTAVIHCSLADSSRLIRKKALEFLRMIRTVHDGSDDLVDFSRLEDVKNRVKMTANSGVYSPRPWKTLAGSVMLVLVLLYAALAYAYRYPPSISNGELVFTSIALPVLLVPGFVIGGQNPFRIAVMMAVLSCAVSLPVIWLVQVLDTLTGMVVSFGNVASIIMLFTGLGFTGGLIGSQANRMLFLVGDTPTSKNKE